MVFHEGCCNRRLHHVISVASAWLLAGALILITPIAAYADGGVHFVEGDVQVSQSDGLVSPEPGASSYLIIEFDKNVAYPNYERSDDFAENNLSLITLEKADGTPVEDYSVVAGVSNDDRRVFYIYIYDWLDPLTEYQVVMAPGIEAANGEDVSDEEYTFTFKTDARCKNGLSIYENIGIPTVGILLLCGMTFQIVRSVRQRRRRS
jgi:hypothetical protein